MKLKIQSINNHDQRKRQQPITTKQGGFKCKIQVLKLCPRDLDQHLSGLQPMFKLTNRQTKQRNPYLPFFMTKLLIYNPIVSRRHCERGTPIVHKKHIKLTQRPLC